MQEMQLLSQVALVTAAGAVVTVAFSRVRLPVVTGLIAAGALIGPFGLRLLREAGDIETLAGVGVVLLMFTIGLEFSFGRLRLIFRRVALGGFIQVAGTTAAVLLIAVAMGQSHGRAVLFGFVFALSSTAIVLKALSVRGELDAPHGKFIVGALIFQDLCVVPMVLLVPVLSVPRPPGEVALGIAAALGQAAVVVACAALASRYVVPTVLRFVDASRSREVFLFAILAMCVGTAWLTSLAGLSLALGAFLGGMVVGGTEFQHRAMGDLIPLRDAFVSVFFVSLGMLLDVRLLLVQPLTVALLLAGFVVGKAAIATIAAASMRFPARAAWLAGAGLAQFGEFGFVLVTLALGAGLMQREEAGVLLAAGVLSMFITPMLISIAPKLTAGEKLVSHLYHLLGVRGIENDEVEREIRDHVLLIGYGIAGRMTARALAASSVTHVVLEMNAETVRKAKEAGEPVFYADATSEEALNHAGAMHAKVAVVQINDPEAALRVVDTIRRTAPSVPVIVRTRYHGDREKLLKLGAADVVIEEIEAGIELLGRVLRKLSIPRNVIEARVREMRDELKTSVKTLPPRGLVCDARELSGMKIESVLMIDGAPGIGSSPSELKLRSVTGALVVAVRRDGNLLENPSADQRFERGDVVYFVGTGEAVAKAAGMLAGSLEDSIQNEQEAQ